MTLTELGFSAYLQAHLGDFTQPFSIFAARWLIILVFVATFLATIAERDRVTKHAWRELWWSVALALVTSLTLAALIGRVRPFHDPSGLVRALVPNPASEYSFPSSHASTIWAWAFAASWIHRPAAWLWVLIATLVALGRVFVGVHYLSDVLAGMVVGAGAFFIVRFGHRFTQRIVAS